MTSGKAPEFDLPALSGGSKSLLDLLSEGPVLLVFYKVACPTCQLTLPYLEKLGRARTAGAPRVIAISQDDSCATAQFNFRFGISNLTTLLDPPPYRVSNAYGIENVPSLFLVEQDGRISRSVAGFEKAEMIRLGERCGVELFTARDRVPVFQPG